MAPVILIGNDFRFLPFEKHVIGVETIVGQISCHKCQFLVIIVLVMNPSNDPLSVHQWVVIISAMVLMHIYVGTTVDVCIPLTNLSHFLRKRASPVLFLMAVMNTINSSVFVHTNRFVFIYGLFLLSVSFSDYYYVISHTTCRRHCNCLFNFFKNYYKVSFSVSLVTLFYNIKRV